MCNVFLNVLYSLEIKMIKSKSNMSLVYTNRLFLSDKEVVLRLSTDFIHRIMNRNSSYASRLLNPTAVCPPAVSQPM